MSMDNSFTMRLSLILLQYLNEETWILSLALIILEKIKIKNLS